VPVLRPFLIPLVAGVVLAQQVDFILSPNFMGDDIEEFFRSSASPKSEFETTA
jgi:hypothetical protein